MNPNFYNQPQGSYGSQQQRPYEVYQQSSPPTPIIASKGKRPVQLSESEGSDDEERQIEITKIKEASSKSKENDQRKRQKASKTEVVSPSSVDEKLTPSKRSKLEIKLDNLKVYMSSLENFGNEIVIAGTFIGTRIAKFLKKREGNSEEFFKTKLNEIEKEQFYLFNGLFSFNENNFYKNYLPKQYSFLQYHKLDLYMNTRVHWTNMKGQVTILNPKLFEKDGEISPNQYLINYGC